MIFTQTSSTSRSDKSGVKTRSKRGITAEDDEKITSTKRRKTSTSAQATKQSTEDQQIFSCDLCLYDWGSEMKSYLYNELHRTSVPDPKTSIQTFSTFKEYKAHYFIAHDDYSQEQIDNGCLETGDFCQEKSCLESFKESFGIHKWPHGDINCEVCGLSFKVKEHRDDHMEVQHANINMMSKEEILDLYRFYEAI